MDPMDVHLFDLQLNDLPIPPPIPCRARLEFINATYKQIGPFPIVLPTYANAGRMKIKVTLDQFTAIYHHERLYVLLCGHLGKNNIIVVDGTGHILERIVYHEETLCPPGVLTHRFMNTVHLRLPAFMPSTYHSPQASIIYRVCLMEDSLGGRLIAEKTINVESVYYPLSINHPHDGFQLQLIIKRLEHPSNGEITFHIMKRGMERQGIAYFIMVKKQRIHTTLFAQDVVLGHSGIIDLERNAEYRISLAPFGFSPSSSVLSNFDLSYTLKLRCIFLHPNLMIDSNEIVVHLLH